MGDGEGTGTPTYEARGSRTPYSHCSHHKPLSNGNNSYTATRIRQSASSNQVYWTHWNNDYISVRLKIITLPSHITEFSLCLVVWPSYFILTEQKQKSNTFQYSTGQAQSFGLIYFLKHPSILTRQLANTCTMESPI